MKPSVEHTFVIPAYKESIYLDECISSLLAQTVRSKIILSTSTPSSFLSAKSLQYDLPLVVNQKSGGIADDWNFAYDSADTPFLTLAHQDDVYAPRYAEVCLRAIKKANTVISFTDYIENANNTVRYFSVLLIIKRLILAPFFIRRSRLGNPIIKKILLSIGNPICCPSIMYNKKQIGTFVFDTTFRMNLDWEATMRLADIQGDFVYIPARLLSRRIHPNSETSRAARLNIRHSEDLRVIRKFWPKSLAALYFRLYSISHGLNG